MARKDLLKKLERAARGRARKKHLADVFLANVASLRGEGDPHPLAGTRPEWSGTLLDGMHTVGDGPIEDLSES